MAYKEQQQGYPLAPANGFIQSDAEGASLQSDELRRQKRNKCILYIFLFAVFQIGVITLFSLTIMKFKSPKFRVRSATFSTFQVTPSGALTPTFDLAMSVDLGVKNTNFGPFKYRNTTVDFYYKNEKIGEVFVPNAKANIKSTRKIENLLVNLSSSNITSTSELTSDLNSGTLPLTSRSTLRGKVTIMFMMKKNRNSNMDCTMNVVLASRQLQDIVCR